MKGRVPRLRGVSIALLLAAQTALFPTAVLAWGLAAHRWVAKRAGEIAGASCAPLVGGRRSELTERSVEPDTVLRGRLGRSEEVRHFLDLDEYGAPPFRALPRIYDDAVEKFGRELVRERGILPWHGGRLARRLRGEIRRGDWSAARRTAGHLAHYAADATMPLHATKNHDGQLSGQRGLHQRVEAMLGERWLDEYGSRAAAVPALKPIAPEHSEAALFAALLDSYDAMAPVLAADRTARRGTWVGSPLYHRRLDADLGALIAKRLGTAAALTAALWEGACAPETRASPSARLTPAAPAE